MGDQHESKNDDFCVDSVDGDYVDYKDNVALNLIIQCEAKKARIQIQNRCSKSTHLRQTFNLVITAAKAVAEKKRLLSAICNFASKDIGNFIR